MPSKSPGVSRYWFVESADLRTCLSQDYHESTKASEFLFQFGDEDPKRTASMMNIIDAVAGNSKNYSYAPRIALEPAAWTEIDAPLGELLRDRRTNRDFSQTPLTLNQLATILVRGAGITGKIPGGAEQARDGRAYPSGGALYPLEIYALVLNVGGIAQGLYHFNVHAPCLYQLLKDDIRETVQTIFMGDDMLPTAAVAFLVTAVFKRSSFKYGERAYRLVHIEAGHLVHNLILVGQALGVSVVPVNGFFDRKLEGLLDIDGVEESVLYTALAGCPAP